MSVWHVEWACAPGGHGLLSTEQEGDARAGDLNQQPGGPDQGPQLEGGPFTGAP
jgi:hypothetical protein